VVGGNLRTAKLIGLPVSKLFVITCALGGAAAGLAGSIEVAAIHGAANATLYARAGFAGILVAFLARQQPLAIIPAALLLGGIQASGGVLQRRHQLPDAVVEVFKGTLFVVILFSESYVGRARAWAERMVARRASAEETHEAQAVVAPSIAATAAVPGAQHE
jgi:simple sugar transport system permease protein